MEDPEQRSFLARKIFPEGTEPDPRFTLANERTFLAWVRTSLAFLAGAIALEAFTLPSISEEMQTIGAAGVCMVALLVAAGAAIRWVRVERAMRVNKPLPVPGIVPVLVIACVIGAAVVLIGVLR